MEPGPSIRLFAMLGKLPEALQKFFGFVGASLTGLTAICTAAGFLAERARLGMLGLPATAFDLQQYLETGARFLAYLPIYLGTALLLALADLFGLRAPPVAPVAFPAPPPGALAQPAVVETLRVETERGVEGGLLAWIVGLLLVAVAMAALWHYRAGWRGAWQKLRAPRHATRAFRTRHRTLILLLFLLVQFAGACQQARTVRVRDLLFSPSATAPVASPPLLVAPETLERWVRAADYDHAVQYLGGLFLLTMGTAWALYRMLKPVRLETAGGWERAWIGASGLLLVSQVTLLPVCYGVLLSSNRFPSVCVAYAPSDALPEPPPERLALVHQNGDGYYLYAQQRRRMWFVPQDGVAGLTFFGMVDVLHPLPPSPSCP